MPGTQFRHRRLPARLTLSEWQVLSSLPREPRPHAAAGAVSTVSLSGAGACASAPASVRPPPPSRGARPAAVGTDWQPARERGCPAYRR